MYTAQDLQRTVLQIARDRCANPRRWMTELASVLNKTKHSIYKKVQGDIGLSLEEVLRLAEHYDLSIDPLLRPDTALSFEFVPVYAPGHVVRYLEGIEARLEEIAGLPGIGFWCSGIELPFVHAYNFPRLMAFKFYIHDRMFGIDERRAAEQFNPQRWLNDDAVTGSMRRILERYYTVPSVEFWNAMILDITLNQIRYALEAGLFADPGQALALCEDLDQFVVHTELMAARGVKVHAHDGRAGAPFDLYHNEIAHSNNLILAASAGVEYMFVSFGNPNYIYTATDRAVTYTREWFQSLQSHSQRLARAPLKTRVAFFNRLRRRVAHVRAQLEAFITLHVL
ncbi:MAG: hypothetical protein R3301_04230 [Saprospiraceae bacterium]|nr:hypothetical protein [Saprospiraceae bacterium]